MPKLNKKVAEMIRQNLDNEIYNTWYLSSDVYPRFTIEDGNICVSYDGKRFYLDRSLECLLRALCLFSYCPLWYFNNNLKHRNFDSADDWLYELMGLNMVFAENLTNGVFLRPTAHLYRLFKLPQKSYREIPYNMLTHDMSKFDIYYHCMLGDQETIASIVKNANAQDLVYPPNVICSEKKDYSVLNLLDGADNVEPSEYMPLLIIDESDIKVHKSNTEKISQVENAIIDDMKKGKVETYELLHHDALFATNVNQKNDIVLQFPDLIVPVKRNADLSPNSIAIEMELTAKAPSHYIENVAKYKNNLKYGVVVWFVNSMRTRARIYDAYKHIGGTGYTKTYIINYVTPREYIMERKKKGGG